MKLPRPFGNKVDRAYIDTLVRSLEKELQGKADRQAGTIYVGREQNLVYVEKDTGDQVPVPAGYAIESGSNVNGEWVKFPDGTLICRTKKLVMEYAGADRCMGTWTFPYQFSSVNYSMSQAFVGPSDGSNANGYASGASPSVNQISDLGAGNMTASSVILAVNRINGQTDFASGDRMYASVTAIGRWK